MFFAIGTSSSDPAPARGLSMTVLAVYGKEDPPRKESLPADPALKDLASDQVFVRRRLPKDRAYTFVPGVGLVETKVPFWHVDHDGAHGAEDDDGNDDEKGEDDGDDEKRKAAALAERYRDSLERLERRGVGAGRADSSSSSALSPYKDPTVFDDQYWEDLPSDAREAYGVLGYDADAWNGEVDVVEHVKWRDLSPARREAASFLGYNEHTWSSWDDLDEDARRAYVVLGYDRESWDGGGDDDEGGKRVDAETRYWDKLDEDRRWAAAALGWTEETWNGGNDENDDDPFDHPLEREDRVFEERTVLIQTLEHYRRLRRRDDVVGASLPVDDAATLDDPRFGEQLLVEGADADAVRVGDVFACGALELEVTSPRRACAYLDRKNDVPYGRRGLAARVNADGTGGWFARVHREGTVREGDALVRTRSPHPAWTIGEVARALYNEGDRRHAALGWAQWARSRKELEELCAIEAFGWYEWRAEAQWILDRWGRADVMVDERDGRARRRFGLATRWDGWRTSALVLLIAWILHGSIRMFLA